jgi:hypothetical protein
VQENGFKPFLKWDVLPAVESRTGAKILVMAS